MPPVIAAVGIAAVGAIAGVALGAITVGSALVSVGVTALTAGASYLLAPKIKASSAVDASEAPQAAPANQARTITSRQATPLRRFAYGRVKTGGALFFEDNANPYLYQGYALSDGVIGGFVNVYFGDVLIPLVDTYGYGNYFDAAGGSIYEGNFVLEFRPGDRPSAYSTLLFAAFAPAVSNETFRQEGVAKAVVQLNWGTDSTEHNLLWGNSIQPLFLIEGMKVYDPRDGGQDADDPDTWEYSNNPALCLAHALTNMWWAAIDPDFIDWDAVGDAADVCDATVTYNGEPYARFQLSGIFQAGFDVPTQVADMLSSFGGALYYSDGLYKIRADEDTASVWTIEDADILGIGEFVAEGDTVSTPTAIRAKYFDQQDEGDENISPVYESALVATEGYREKTINVPFCSQNHSAQILAFRHLAYAQDGRAVNLTLRDCAIYLEPFDVVMISSETAPFLNGDYRVMQVDLVDQGVAVTLQGRPSGAYAAESTYLQ